MTTKAAKRLSFSKIREALPIEELDLVAIQNESFEWLFATGLGEVFDEISPIEDTQGRMALSFIDHRFEDAKHTPRSARRRTYTYSRPLFVTAEFLNKDDGTIKSQTVFKWVTSRS